MSTTAPAPTSASVRLPRRPSSRPEGLVKTFGRVVGLDGVDLDLYPGEVLAIIGDNGAGKSTLIKACHRGDDPGRRRDPARRRGGQLPPPQDAREAGIETVYQTLAVAPALDIASNMFLGREMRRTGSARLGAADARPQGHARAAPAQSMSDLGIGTLQNMTQAVETLSGGQRQAVAVARAAAFASKLIVLDEPTAALGVKETNQVLSMINRVRENGPAGHPDQPQHAERVRGRRPDPHPAARRCAGVVTPKSTPMQRGGARS